MKTYAVVGAVGAAAVLALGVWKVAGSVHPGADVPKVGKGDVRFGMRRRNGWHEFV